VNCDEVNPWLNSYVDGELDLSRNLEVETHLRGCAPCSAKVEELRQLGQTLQDPEFYHRAPTTLRQRVRASLRPALSSRREVETRVLRSLAVAACFGLVAVLIWGVQRHLVARPGEDLLAQEVVANHIRSLLLDELPRVDKASTEQHEVKPWFNGRVPFSPAVRNLDSEGYELVGGRLDYFNNHRVAAVVYKHRKHPINLFTWPEPGHPDEPPRAQSRQGYQVVHWTQNGMTYWAVSDLNEEELMQFAGLMRR
jgi:anti-sigma factor RsiW